MYVYMHMYVYIFSSILLSFFFHYYCFFCTFLIICHFVWWDWSIKIIIIMCWLPKAPPIKSAIGLVMVTRQTVYVCFVPWPGGPGRGYTRTQYTVAWNSVTVRDSMAAPGRPDYPSSQVEHERPSTSVNFGPSSGSHRFAYSWSKNDTC